MNGGRDVRPRWGRRFGTRRGMVAALVLAAALSGVSASSAQAQTPEALDRAALESFHNLDIDAARAGLDRAIAAGARLPASARARLLVHRGVVALTGQGDRTQATNDFMAALTLDPAVEVDSALSSPEVQAAFELAHQRVVRGTTMTSGPGTASTPGSTVAPATTDGVSTTPSIAPEVAVVEADATTVAAGGSCIDAADCGDGLLCDRGLCSPTPAPFVEPATPARFFFQVGYGFGAGYAGANMRADSGVPYDPSTKPAVWNDSVNGAYAPPGYTETQWQNVQLATYGSYVSPGSSGSGNTIAASPDCTADAGEYCVRVQQPGFSSIGGLRFAFGYWITPRIGASMEWRVQTHAGNGTFSRVMGSLRVHYRITAERNTGLRVDAFAGVGFGQIQLRPNQGRYLGPSLCEQGSVGAGQRCDDPAANATPSAAYLQSGTEVQRPFIQTGPLSAQLGANVAYHFTRSIGAFARPTVYMMFPDTTVAMELTLGGEVAF